MGIDVTKSVFVEATNGCLFMRGVFGGRYWFKKNSNDVFAYQNSLGYFLV